MQTIALRENVRGASSIHEPAVAEPVVLDCGEFTAITELRNFVPRILDSMRCFPLRRLDIEIHDSRFLLRGSVPTFYLKQLALCTIPHDLRGLRNCESRGSHRLSMTEGPVG